MNAVNFLPKTDLQIKYLKKNKIREEKEQRYRIPADPAKRKRLAHLITLTAMSIELLNDCIDEMRDMKVMGAKHLIVESQNELLNLQKMFIESAMSKGESAEIERIQQQKAFENFINHVSALNTKQFEILLNYTENLKNK